MQVLIRDKKGAEPRWVDLSEVLGKGTKTTYRPAPTLEFENWYNLYDKKTTKKEAIAYWKRHITKEDYVKIMAHTKQYIIDRPKVYRKDPIRYLKNRVFEDEIISTEKKIDLDESYPFDKSGSARLGRCNACNSIVFGNKFTIHKEDSDCCKAKINPYR